MTPYGRNPMKILRTLVWTAVSIYTAIIVMLLLVVLSINMLLAS